MLCLSALYVPGTRSNCDHNNCQCTRPDGSPSACSRIASYQRVEFNAYQARDQAQERLASWNSRIPNICGERFRVTYRTAAICPDLVSQGTRKGLAGTGYR